MNLLKLMLLTLITFPLIAFACPNLTGKRSCYTKDRQKEYVSIKQEDIENEVLYQMTDRLGTKVNYYADGKESIWMEGPFEKSQIVTCEGDESLNSIIRTTNSDGEQHALFALRMQSINGGKRANF